MGGHAAPLTCKETCPTAAKIEASPLLLKALRTESPEEAMEAFKQQLDKLSDDDKRVLSNAFNLS